MFLISRNIYYYSKKIIYLFLKIFWEDKLLKKDRRMFPPRPLKPAKGNFLVVTFAIRIGAQRDLQIWF
jgi:hypothetical protein